MRVIPAGMNRRDFLFTGAGTALGLPLGVVGTKLMTPPSIQSELLTLYPESPKYKPFSTFYLPVPGGHELYIEQVGNPNGIPIVFLHGGPGYWFTEANKRFFDPDIYRIMLFDQRGANRSKPLGRLERNTTEDATAGCKKCPPKHPFEAV